MGQLPHRDFFEVIPPGSFLPTALAFWLWGPSVWVARTLTLLYAGLLGFAFDAVALRLGVSWLPRAAALSFLIPFGVWCWPMPSHHWVATILQLIAVYAFLRAMDQSSFPSLWGAGAGLASGYACASLQDQGAYFVLLVLGGSLLWSRGDSRRRAIFLGWLAGLGAIGAAFAFYLLPGVPLPALWEQLVSFPASRYSAFINRSDFWMGWKTIRAFHRDGGFSQLPIYGSTLVALYAFLTLVPFASALCLAAGTVRRWAGRPQLFFLAAATAAALGCTFHRWSPQNLLWAVPLLLPSVVLGLERGLRVPRPALPITLRICLFGFTCLWIVHAALFAHLCEPSRCRPVAGPAGILRSFKHAEADSLQSVLTAIEHHVPPGCPLFCERYCPLINFMSLRPNPTRYTIFLHPEYNTPPQVEEVITSLRSHSEARVLLMRPPRRDDAFQRYVLAEFSEVWSSPYAALYARNPTQRDGNPP
jgi:hypothetical protein